MRKMTRLFVASLLMTALASCGEQPKKVYEPKEVDVFPTLTNEAIPYRIPAITTTSQGDLLAVADFRHCRADIGYGRVDLHARISKDNGKTWEKAIQLSDQPTAYSDMLILPNGDVMIFYERGAKRPYDEMVIAVISKDIFK